MEKNFPKVAQSDEKMIMNQFGGKQFWPKVFDFFFKPSYNRTLVSLYPSHKCQKTCKSANRIPFGWLYAKTWPLKPIVEQRKAKIQLENSRNT